MRLKGDIKRLRRRLDMPARLKDSVKHNPSRWFLGTTAAGLGSALLIPRFLCGMGGKSQKTSNNPGKKSRLLGFVWTVARPVVKTYLTQQLREWLLQQGRRTLTKPPKTQPN